MKYILPIVTAVLAATLVFFLMHHTMAVHGRTSSAAIELTSAKESVTKRFQEITHDIEGRLTAFSEEVAVDQLFSLRLLAESNRSAPEVTLKAGQFLKPMGFSLLDIADSSCSLLSSGEFPASAGSSVSQKVKVLSEEAKILEDNIMGQKALTLQAKRKFMIAGSIPFYALGGCVVDERFLDELSPCSTVRVLLKQGTSVTGMPSVRTISEVKDDKIIINDKEYPAFEIAFPYAGAGETPRLIGVLEHRR
jgi:hypothetical protein